MTGLRKWLKRLMGVRRRITLSSDYLEGRSTGSDAALQAGLELVTEGIVLLDSAGRIETLNNSAHTLMRSGLVTLHGADFWEALPEALSDQHRSAAEKTLFEAGAGQFVAHHAFEDQWIEFTLRQHSQGVVVTLKDVSDAQRALRALRDSEFCNQTLFDANPLAMWLFDAPSRRLLAGNQAAAALYGLAQDDFSGNLVEVLFPDGEGAALIDSLPVGDFHQEMRLCTQKKADGEHILVELACGSLQWQLRPAVLVGVVDVGARHLADAQLRRLNTQLERRVEQSSQLVQRTQNELQAFTYAMSHDLKAPLHVVSGFAGTLAERYSSVLDVQGRHYLERIQASTRQLAKLIDDLRTLTYLPRVTPVPEPVDLAEVCRRLLDELGKREPQRQVTLEMPDSLVVTGDRTLLVTALSCLIDNAWKFTSRKTQGWIKVGLMPGRAPGEDVLFVSDNGAGFDAAYADKLFVAFQRLHSSVDFPGSGLGLAIVRRAAQMLGGDAWGVTADQGGASFFMSLPKDRSAEAPQADGS